MKHISKIFAVAMAALTVATYSTAVVGATEIKSCPQVKIVCNSTDCSNIKNDLEKICKDKNCNLNEILKYVEGYCPDGNCSVDKPITPSQQPTIQPSEPSVKPTEPIVTPTPTLPPASSQTNSAEYNTAYETEVLRLVNVERAKYGLSALALDSGATEVAHVRAKEIVTSFSHTRPNGSSCFTAADELDISYRFAGENIAYGYPTPEKVVNGWMNSEGHRKNILSSSFSKIGIGCYENNGILYWSQFFIG